MGDVHCRHSGWWANELCPIYHHGKILQTEIILVKCNLSIVTMHKRNFDSVKILHREREYPTQTQKIPIFLAHVWQIIFVPLFVKDRVWFQAIFYKNVSEFHLVGYVTLIWLKLLQYIWKPRWSRFMQLAWAILTNKTAELYQRPGDWFYSLTCDILHRTAQALRMIWPQSGPTRSHIWQLLSWILVAMMLLCAIW